MTAGTASQAAAAERTRSAYLRACLLDVAVRKPGNVSVDSPGHRMTAAQFLASATASAPAVCCPGTAVGERIEAATRASWAAAGCNTNLGIVLLCAPLALAAERLAAQPRGVDGGSLREALRAVLAGLDIDDARAAFRAIAQANPGGLGAAPQQDVRAEPSVDLRAAMALAAPRDRIAQQYVDGFAAVFEIGVPALRDAPAGRPSAGFVGRPAAPPSTEDVLAVQRAYLALLASGLDSHIVRKRGEPPAHTVMRQAQHWRVRHAALAGADDAALAAGWAAWDDALKADGINPGTTADLTVASLFVAGLLGDQDAHVATGSSTAEWARPAPSSGTERDT